jgi:teichoic acid transport system ATP-binding protein
MEFSEQGIIDMSNESVPPPHLTLRVSNLSVAYETRLSSRKGKRVSRSRRISNQVIEDVSFDAHAGEFIGVVGANGSGKSTLLKAVAGFIPHQGGSITAISRPQLLSVSAAMRSGMSGWENITLGCLALGIRYSELEQVGDEIAEFCELGSKLDLPIKALSSGEKARLQFGIATVRTPRILMIDEALGVGDKRFRERSVQRMNKVLENTGTIFFVSHSLEEVTRLCTRALWLVDGQIVADDLPKAVVKQYVDWVDQHGADKKSTQEALRYRSRRQAKKAQRLGFENR